jgi:hypothetical protein
MIEQSEVLRSESRLLMDDRAMLRLSIRLDAEWNKQ